MRKRNTTEIDKATIMFLDKMLPKAGEDARRILADPFGFSLCYAKKGKRAEQNKIYWCCDCGGEFPLGDIKDYRTNPEYERRKKEFKYTSYRLTHLGTCPHCGKPMKIEHWPMSTQILEDVVSFKAKMGEWEITRFYNEKQYCKAGREPQVYIEDIGANWTRDGKTYSYIARIGGMFYSKYWKADTRHFSNGMGCSNPLNVAEEYAMPAFSLEDELTRRGIDLDNLHGLKLTQILNLMDNPHFETLWKQGDWQIAKFFKRDLEYYWAQIRIARKHGYVLNEENLTEWRDMVSMLRLLRMDDHNPRYLCPENLHEAHNALVAEHERRDAIMRERWRREADERAREQARIAMLTREETNEEFIKRRSKYFDISIVSDKGYTIVALKSVDEFEREGDILHHCVYRCGYYNKANSLILSARDADNNPIETIEIDLHSFEIKQCYGEHDTFSKLHKDIVKTMKANMWQVKDISKGKMAIAS